MINLEELPWRKKRKENASDSKQQEGNQQGQQSQQTNQPQTPKPSGELLKMQEMLEKAKHHRENLADLEKTIPDKEEELSEKAHKIIEKDMDSWLGELSQEYKKATASVDKNKQELLNIFTTVFTDLKSRTVEVEGVKITGQKLTVGKTGFGIRWNVKSEPISRYEATAILQIIENAEPIAEWMENNRMKGHAENLRKFVKHAKTTADSTLEMDCDVTEPLIMTSRWGNSYNSVKGVKMNGSEFRAIVEDKEGDTETEKILEFQKVGRNSLENYTHLNSPYVFLRTRELFKGMHQEYVDKCKVIQATAQQEFDQLKEEFKKELTLRSL